MLTGDVPESQITSTGLLRGHSVLRVHRTAILVASPRTGKPCLRGLLTRVPCHPPPLESYRPGDLAFPSTLIVLDSLCVLHCLEL